MKRYLLFAGDVYYPVGGWDDFRGAYDTIEEAQSASLAYRDTYEWFHIVDTVEMKQVEHLAVSGEVVQS